MLDIKMRTIILVVSCLICGCAIPGFVRECNTMAAECSQLQSACESQSVFMKIESASLQVCTISRSTCDAELERIMFSR